MTCGLRDSACMLLSVGDDVVITNHTMICEPHILINERKGEVHCIDQSHYSSPFLMK